MPKYSLNDIYDFLGKLNLTNDESDGKRKMDSPGGGSEKSKKKPKKVKTNSSKKSAPEIVKTKKSAEDSKDNYEAIEREVTHQIYRGMRLTLDFVGAYA